MASLTTEKAETTRGTLMSRTAVANVAARPIAACLSDTAHRFSSKAQAIARRAKMPRADCKVCILVSSPVARIEARAESASANPGYRGITAGPTDAAHPIRFWHPRARGRAPRYADRPRV